MENHIGQSGNKLNSGFGFFSILQAFISALLRALGLSNKSGTILLLGLDNAGKTTLLHRLRTGSLLPHPPTERPRMESFVVGGVTFKAWDVGGHEAVRHLWDDFACNHPDAVLFLVDSADVDRMWEAGEELDALVGEEGTLGLDVPVAVLLNKCDLEVSLGSAEIAQNIGYGDVVKRHGDGKVGMFRISVAKGEGYEDAIKWIASFL